MHSSLSRREFARRTFFFGSTLALGMQSRAQTHSPNSKIVAAVMGTNGRGQAHIAALLAQHNVEVAYICDVDDRAVKKGLDLVARHQSKPAQGIKDVRRLLEKKELDVLTIAAPNHWQAIAAVWACQAGKDVYVEKPGSHNAAEAIGMAEAAARHRRHMQLGTQRRSWPWVKEAISELHGGSIGNVTYAKAWYNAARGTLGRGNTVPVPDWLNYDLWQGPATHRPYKDNVVHYNWHWQWHWGGGELANNGVHALDLVRWGLKVGLPEFTSCTGGRYHFQDDQETPDTAVASYDFGAVGASWEGHSCDLRGQESSGFGVTFYGSKGALVIADNNATFYDNKNKPVKTALGSWDDKMHFKNFIGTIRGEATLNANIADTYKSALLCHLGNMAYRSQSTVRVKGNKLISNKEAAKFWNREYRKGFGLG